MRLFFLSIMAAYLLGNGYISFRAWQFLTEQPLAVRWGVVALIWVAALALMVAMMLRHAAVPAWLGQTLFTVGSSWMVVTLYLVLSLVVVDLLRLCGFTLRFGFVWLCSSQRFCWWSATSTIATPKWYTSPCRPTDPSRSAL